MVTEDLNLEYKSADSLKNDEGRKIEISKDISKDISSMANSAGGIVIYGIKEYNDKKMRHLPEKIDPVDGNVINREWLQQIINSAIQPKIENLKIDAIYEEIGPNKVIYVVTIPQSETAHQAKDHKYYKRYNSISVPMEDYEIRDIMNRNKNPIIELNFKIVRHIYYRNDPIMPSHFQTKEKIENLELFIRMVNKGRILANYVNYSVEIPSLIYEENHSRKLKKNINGVEYLSVNGDNTIRDIVGSSGAGSYFVPKYGPSRYDPILPSLKSYAKEVSLNINTALDERYLYWKTFADNALPKSGKIRLNEIEYEEIDDRNKLSMK